ncbi:hypothetical protein A9F13_03g01639 [Clavispora lusitaniae]|uniref:Uncharacterized protein n=1 Tax=Clavispora lusitaniae TaxID=36911 RepID=A0AA91Q2E1_CLALS|nr:hypothetical protein A9F13_03g01639 [Clavispora lusitaniae]
MYKRSSKQWPVLAGAEKTLVESGGFRNLFRLALEYRANFEFRILGKSTGNTQRGQLEMDKWNKRNSGYGQQRAMWDCRGMVCLK